MSESNARDAGDGAGVKGGPAELVRALGPWDAISLTVGAVIGTGVFLVASDIAKALPHGGLLLAVFLVGGLLSLSGALTLGWGPFPDAPVAEYMARSNSALSAFYGGLLWVLSFDVWRYRGVIRYQAVAIMAYSLAGLILGRAAGMPWWFVLGDFIGCWVFCGPMWVLAGKSDRPAQQNP